MNAEPTISSQPRPRRTELVVVGVILSLLFVWLCSLEWRALAAHERFAAPKSFLLSCFAVGFVVLGGWALFNRWQVESGRAVVPSSMLPGFIGAVTFIALPKVAAGWFGMIHKLARPAAKDVEAQAEGAIIVGFLLACGFAFLFRKTPTNALDRPQASDGDEFKCQRPTSP